MANYSATNGSTGLTQISMTSTYGGVVTVGGPTSAPRRGKMYDILVGTDGTPGDTALDFQVCRVTSVTTGAGGGTLFTLLPLDPADAAATTVCTINSTGTNTVTANSQLWFIGMNQRASYRWVCAPGSELVWPTTASNGLSLQGKSASYTGTVSGNAMIQEQ